MDYWSFNFYYLLSNNFYKIEIINQYSINTNEYSSSDGEKTGVWSFIWSGGKQYVDNFKSGWIGLYRELAWSDEKAI